MKSRTLFVVLALFLVSFAKAQTTAVFPLGQIEQIQSKELGETRILNILLPDGYNADSATTYPVIYLLDGSAHEDYTHIASLVQFLSMYDLMPQSIVVGIANVDRRRDFTFPTTVAEDLKTYPTTGHSDTFIAFIEKEVQPFIEKKFKTNGSKTIIGQSLGGLLATEILLKKPQLFDHYIIVSPSLWWDNESLLKQVPTYLQAHPELKRTVYIAVGHEHPTMVKDAKKLSKLLKTKGGENCHVTFQYFGKEDHATILHRAVYAAFEAFYPKVKK